MCGEQSSVAKMLGLAPRNFAFMDALGAVSHAYFVEQIDFLVDPHAARCLTNTQ